MSVLDEVELGPDTVTEHTDGTYTIDWCGGKIERMDLNALKDLSETLMAILTGSVAVVTPEKLEELTK